MLTWVERGTVRAKWLAQEHNTRSQARTRARTARSGDERNNHQDHRAPTSFPRTLRYLCAYCSACVHLFHYIYIVLALMKISLSIADSLLSQLGVWQRRHTPIVR